MRDKQTLEIVNLIMSRAREFVWRVENCGHDDIDDGYKKLTEVIYEYERRHPKKHKPLDPEREPEGLFDQLP